VNDSDVQELLQERADMVSVPPPPIDAVLRDETARRGRRRRAVLVTATLAAAAVTAVAVVAHRPSGDAGSLPTTQTSNGTQMSGTVPTDDQLIGSWRAVTLNGQPAPTTAPPNGSLTDLLTLRFAILGHGHLWWGGQDWCTSSAGRVRLGTEGQFSTFNDATPGYGCDFETYNPPDVSVRDVVVQAAFVRLLGDTLSLYGDDGSPLATFERAGPDSTPTSRPSNHHGSLSASEYSLAVAAATQIQSKVTGTFIGATAVATGGPERCSLHIRLVWKKDANFVHSHLGQPVGQRSGGPGLLPDGPRKALLVAVDPQTGDVCGTGAKYRDVGAAADETLLYGHWPG
jgi:hypothetical protein